MCRVRGWGNCISIIITGLCLLCPGPCLGLTHQVPGDFPSIQAAIDAASDLDVIIVDPGIYKENLDFGGKGVTVSSIDPNDAEIVALTILDGSEAADPNFAGVAMFTQGEGANAVLTGFTIQNGSGQSDFTINWRSVFDGSNGDGGAIICRNASPTIAKNVFKNNHSLYGGGAIFCHNNASPSIDNNTFINNTTFAYGGAIFCRLKCSPVISNNIFKDNVCEVLGGAVYLADQSHATITGNWFEGNRSNHLTGGALYYFVGSHPLVANNVFLANIAWSGGSAIAVESPAGKIVNNTIVQNRILNPSSFSAAVAVFADVKIANNIVFDNEGGGVYLGSTGSADFSHNNFWNNGSGNFLGNVDDQTGLNGNISTDPLVGVNLPAPFSSFELLPGSACVDAGNNADLPAGLVTDYDDSLRIVGTTVDMGAQEYDAIGVPEDHLTIQGAIHAADSGDRILVAQGFYQENIDFAGKNVMLRSYNPLDPNCVDATVIDGDQQASCIKLISGEDKRAVIAGFSIQNGFAEGAFGTDTIYGGGIYVGDNAGATILYNDIHHNRSRSYGGGIDTRHYTDTVIAYNRIEENTTLERMGGGIHVGANAQVLIYRNIITGNVTADNRQGGGIYVFNHSQVDVIENEISENHSGTGGGVYYWEVEGRIVGNIIRNNSAAFKGGGIGMNQSQGGGPLDMVISNNFVEGNDSAGEGGAIYIILGDTRIVNNTIVGNRAPAGMGAGITAAFGADLLIQNNVISSNHPGLGVVGQTTSDPNNFSFPVALSNNVWNNGQNGDENYGGTLGDLNGVDGNVSGDPVFVAEGFWDDQETAEPEDDVWVAGDYRIGWFSANRDAGLTDENSPVEDYHGRARPGFGEIDIGAYELYLHDLTANGTVDLTDILLFSGEWLSSGPSAIMDLTGDEAVDQQDFATLAMDYLEE